MLQHTAPPLRKWIFLQLLIFVLHLGHISAKMEIVNTYTSGSNFSRIIYKSVGGGSNKRDFVYVSSLNTISQLTPNLTSYIILPTGPENFTLTCMGKDCPSACAQHLGPRPPDYTTYCGPRLYNSTVTQWATDSRYLYYCLNVHHGQCRRRELRNLNIGVPNEKPVMVLGARRNISAALYVTAENIYVGTEADIYETLHLSDVFPIMAVRKHDFTLPEKRFARLEPPGRISFVESPGNMLFKYVFGYTPQILKPVKSFVYFVITRNEAAHSKHYVTRIIRLCDGDTDFYSFVEIEIDCVLKEKESHTSKFRQLQTAHVGRVGENLARQLGLPPDEEVLIGSFGDPSMSFKEDDSLPPKSAVCVYPLKELDQMITKVVHNCAQGKGKIGPKHFIGDFAVPKCKVDSDFNFSAPYCPLASKPHNWPVYGTTGDDTVGKFAIFTSPSEITGLVFTPVVDRYTVLVMTTKDGNLYKQEIVNTTSTRSLGSIKLSLDPLEAVTLDPPGKMAYVTTNKKVVRVDLSTCSQFISCKSCLEARDPHCGWCKITGSCEHKSTCSDNGWLSYDTNHQSCPVINSIDPLGLQLDSTNSSEIITISLLNLEELQSISSEPSNQRQCAFYTADTNELIVNKTTLVSAPRNVWTCLSPPRSAMPPLTANQQRVEVKMTVEFEGRELASTSFFHFDCARFTDCYQCAKSSFTCDWCVIENKCVESKTSVNSCPSLSRDLNSDLLVKPYMAVDCPSFTSESNKTIAAGNTVDLAVTVYNTKKSMIIFTCIESCNGIEVSADQLQGGNHIRNEKKIICTFPNMKQGAGKMRQDCRISVYWDNQSGMKRPLMTEKPLFVEVYNCSQMAQRCDQCQYLDVRFNCGWCEKLKTCTTDARSCPYFLVDRTTLCWSPVIRRIFPQTGTSEGKTRVTVYGENLGRNSSDISKVSIVFQQSELQCIVIPSLYVAPWEFQCQLEVLQPKYPQPPVTGTFQLKIKNSVSAESTAEFTFLVPEAHSVKPSRGPNDGGSLIKIGGVNLNVGRNQNIMWMLGNTNTGINCSIVNISATEIWCRTGSLSSIKYEVIRTKRSASLPKATELTLALIYDSGPFLAQPHVKFNYVDNPIVETVDRNKAFVGGGIQLKVTGKYFNLIQNPQIVFYYNEELFLENCNVTTDPMICVTPKIDVDPLTSSNWPLDVEYGFIMDDVIKVQNFAVMQLYKNPNVYTFPNGMRKIQLAQAIDQYGGVAKHNYTTGMPNRQNLEIRLDGAFHNSVQSDDIGVFLSTSDPESEGNTTPPKGNVGRLEVITVMDSFLLCRISNTRGIEKDVKYYVKVRIGNLNFYPGRFVFQVSQTTEELISLIAKILVPTLIALVLVIILAFFINRRNNKQNRKKLRGMEHQFYQLESKVAKECKKGFTELTTSANTYTQNIAAGKIQIPFLSYKEFCIACLFPRSKNIKEHPLLSTFKVPMNSRKSLEDGLRAFSDLIRNETFLLTMVRTMEDSEDFEIQDKVIVASLLSAALQFKMDYFTEILKIMIKDLIEKYHSENKNPRLIMRRTESIVEKMLPNWFAFLLYYFLKERVGEPLFLLHRAIESTVNKGPVDALKGDSKFTLKEDALIRQPLDESVLTLDVTDPERSFGIMDKIQLKAFDVDSITQVKEKILDIIYENKPFSERIQADDVALKLIAMYESINNGSDFINLEDKDHTTTLSQDKCFYQINTLKHYEVKNGATLAIFKRQPEPNGYDTLTSQSYNDLTSTSDSREKLFDFKRMFDNFPHKKGGDSTHYGYRSDSASRIHLLGSPGQGYVGSPLSLKHRSGSLAGGTTLSNLNSGSRMGTFSQGFSKSTATMLSRQEPEMYHLVKPTTQEYDPLLPPNVAITSGKKNAREPTKQLAVEVYLTHLLVTKTYLTTPIDDLFKAMFSTVSRGVQLPMCIKYMFDFLDSQAQQHKISDPEVVHMWKSHCLPLRFWVHIVQCPHAIFDINKEQPAIYNCLNAVSQTLMESCCLSESIPNKDSPSGKLLFAKDVKDYRDRVVRYYQDISRMPPIAEEDMKKMLKEHSVQYEGEFNVSRALTILYKNHVYKYFNQIMERLKKNPEAVRSGLPDTFTKVHANFESFQMDILPDL